MVDRFGVAHVTMALVDSIATGNRRAISLNFHYKDRVSAPHQEISSQRVSLQNAAIIVSHFAFPVSRQRPSKICIYVRLCYSCV